MHLLCGGGLVPICGCRNKLVDEGMDNMLTSKPFRILIKMCFHSSKIPSLTRSSSIQDGIRGVMIHHGSVSILAAGCSMGGVAADAARVDIVAIGPEHAG